ncbi:MAG: helix-turn-helix domain-containing protein, partial [Rhodospirillaceae bacterium]|nr:helix-turn-helix domain-containing protein [Rhodospirillaceae bacterium]
MGELLAQTRQKSGQDIPDVAQSLRISQRYLEAIEEGRNDDLPGTTYAVGFVRSYAEYLGLDEDEIVRRYKDEAEGLEATSELTFPKPIPEGGVPGGVVLLVGALVALIAYGVWYMNSEDQNTPVAQVDAVPERLEVASNKQSATPQEGNVVSKDAVIARSEPVAKPQPEPEPEP